MRGSNKLGSCIALLSVLLLPTTYSIDLSKAPESSNVIDRRSRQCASPNNCRAGFLPNACENGKEMGKFNTGLCTVDGEGNLTTLCATAYYCCATNAAPSPYGGCATEEELAQRRACANASTALERLIETAEAVPSCEKTQTDRRLRELFERMATVAVDTRAACAPMKKYSEQQMSSAALLERYETLAAVWSSLTPALMQDLSIRFGFDVNANDLFCGTFDCTRRWFAELFIRLTYERGGIPAHNRNTNTELYDQACYEAVMAQCSRLKANLKSTVAQQRYQIYCSASFSQYLPGYPTPTPTATPTGGVEQTPAEAVPTPPPPSAKPPEPKRQQATDTADGTTAPE